MKITALIENHSPEELCCEHGLSIWIESDDYRLLLDAGSSNTFIQNAIALDIDLSTADIACLSHGHYDHSGGFPDFFRINQTAKLYIRIGADRDNLSDHGEKGIEYIGIPKELLAQHSDRIVTIEKNKEIFPGIWLLGSDFVDVTQRSLRAGMYYRNGEELLPDDFRHEQTLVLQSTSGLVLFNSCSHTGVPNIVRNVLNLFPNQKIAAFFGGFHMMGRGGASTLGWNEDDVLAEASILKELPVDTFYTCHCTGSPAFTLLKQVLGDRVKYFQTGDIVLLP